MLLTNAPQSGDPHQQPNDTESCSGTVTPMIRETKGCGLAANRTAKKGGRGGRGSPLPQCDKTSTLDLILKVKEGKSISVVKP